MPASVLSILLTLAKWSYRFTEAEIETLEWERSECAWEKIGKTLGGHWHVRWAQKEVPLRSSNQRGGVWCPGIQGAKRAYWMSQIWKVSVDLSVEVMTPGKSSLRKHGKGPRLRVWEFTAVIEKELVERESFKMQQREKMMTVWLWERWELMATRALVEECPQTYLFVGFFVFPANLLIFLFFHFLRGKGGSRTLLTAMFLAFSGHSGAWLAIATDLIARAEVFCTRVSC